EFFQSISDDLIRLSRKYDISIVIGTPRVVGRKIRNSLAIIKKKREILFYDKTHLFRKENDVFEPGNSFVVFKFKNVAFGVLLCYEIGFPEVTRVLTLHGAQVILASFAFGKQRERIYDVATKARAIENGVYLVTSSTVGKGIMNFLGKSRIIHPSGKVLEELNNGEGIITANIDISTLYHYRYKERGDSHAYFKRRRPELYYEIPSLKYPVHYD
ncbi:MAG: carbon-nitrogen hydrolase family protein, partial [Thermotogaceae bacterium]|nr:carbon-nitrogen hydrolase family protein [Thermotogaceae bacterium]